MSDAQRSGDGRRRWVATAGGVAVLTSPGLGFLLPFVGPYVHRPWPWLLGALGAPLAYAGVLLALGIPFLS